MKKKNEKIEMQELELVSIKLQLIERFNLTYIQAAKIVDYIKEEMSMNEEGSVIEETDWLEELIKARETGMVVVVKDDKMVIEDLGGENVE